MTTDIHAPLFIEAEHEKVAMHKMSQDVNEWDENIMEHFHEEYPELSTGNVEVVFKKTDSQRGYGYGYVGLGKEASVQIPVIIKEYELAPLDVMLHDGDAFPLTKESAKKLLHKTAMGKAVAAPQGPRSHIGPSISERVYPGVPWTGGQYKYASVLGALDLSQEQVDTFREKLESSPELVAAWHNSPNKGLLKIAAAKQPKNDIVEAGNGHPLVDAFIKRFGPEPDYGLIERPGRYEVKGISGVRYVGDVYPKVYDFHLRPMDVMLFADGDMNHEDEKAARKDDCSVECGRFAAVQGSIVGKKTGELRDHGGCYASKGDMGFFVVRRGNAAMAFPPMKIQSKSCIDEKRNIHYHKEDVGQDIEVNKRYTIRKFVATDSFGAVYRISVSPNVKEVTMAGGMVMLPGDTTFVRMNKVVKLAAGTEQTKTASAGSSVTLRHLGGDSFSVEADWVDSWTKEGGLRGSVKKYLGQYYTGDSLDAAFTECEKVGRLNINDRAPETVVEVKSYPGAERIARDLTKVASALSDVGLADTVLSLQFINKDNTEKYINFLPQLEKAASHLADMLIGARLGMDLEEYPVKTAMENMVEVIDDLRMLKGK